MRPGRELDTRIAKEIFGHEVWTTNKTVHERTEHGKQPLRSYSREMQWAWGVADKMKISLLPIEGNQWFAFSGTGQGWRSPQEFIEVLQKGEFLEGGAAVGDSPALVICLAALKAKEKESSVAESQKAEKLLKDPENSAEPAPLH